MKCLLALLIFAVLWLPSILADPAAPHVVAVVERAMAAADRDGDGFLSLAEFKTHAEARLQAAAHPPRKKRKKEPAQ